MKLQQGFCKMAVALGLALILTGVAQIPRSAWASMEDAAIFYDELKDQGEWVDYGDHGPVWYPTKVEENWRPYVDGRWTPSEEGYVFETQEPWGYATYHYGNWMPTQEYGWVWVPGRTWYPNTVSWRTSPESVDPDASYIGWAPIPPPNYTPTQGYYPPNYGGGGYYGGLDSLLTAPFWIFTRAASFLLGFNSPYTPSYSYWGSNSLVPVQAVPYYYTRTIIINNYYTPSYYPVDYIGSRGYYNWGPPIPYVARVTRIKQVTINNYMRQANFYQLRNVAPPPNVMARRAYFRDVVPPAMVNQQPLPRATRFQNARVARANLVRPNLVNVNVIKNAPSFSATIPKAQGAGVESGPWRRGVPGAALPSSATIQPNRQMEYRIRNIPSNRRIEPISPSARQWNVPQTLRPAAVQPGPALKHRAPEVTSVPSPTAPGVVPYGRGPKGAPPQTVTPGTPGTPGTPQAGVPQERFNSKKRQPGGPWGKHGQTPEATVTPGQYPKHKQMQTFPPGAPPANTAAPPQSYPPRRLRTQQPVQQQQPAPFQPQYQKKAPAPPPQPQMNRQPSFQPQQVQRQPQPQIQPQMRHQPRPQPQAQPKPQGPQKRQDNRKSNQQD
jgi:hypothetical protein